MAASTENRGAGQGLAAKRAQELEMVSLMTSVYCHGNHGTPGKPCAHDPHLCDECRELVEYAEARIRRCPRMAEKTFCSVCPRPCYRRAMQERMRAVMRYAGPRMLRYRPLAALRHVAATMRAKHRSSRA